MKDPTTYLVARGITLRSWFDPSKSARLDSLHCARVNWEFYYFAAPAERQRFAATPAAYCSLVTDPVSRMRFRPTAKSPHTQHGGVPYYFQSTENLKMFAGMPDSFDTPKYRMRDLGMQPPAAK